MSPPTSEPLEARIDRLESQLTSLQNELSKWSVERTVPAEVTDEYFGFGPAMSKAYFSPTPLSWGATSEFLFVTRENQPDLAGITDLKLFLGYRLSARLTFQSALAFAMSAPGREQPDTTNREPFLDYAVIDWHPARAMAFRAGLVPVPIGERRLRPEPTLYADPLRSRVEEWILPHDLSSPGAIAMIESHRWSLHAGVVASPDVSRLRSGTFFEGSGARFRTAQADPADRFSAVVRLETNLRNPSTSNADISGSSVSNLRVDGLDFVASFLTGDTSHRDRGVSGSRITVSEAHARLAYGRLNLFVLGALGQLRRASEFEQAFNVRPGSRAMGWTSTFYYELTPLPHPAHWPEAGVFVSSEGLELENGAGTVGSPATSRISRAARLGILSKPVPNVVFKIARQWKLGSESIDDNLWQIAVGAVF